MDRVKFFDGQRPLSGDLGDLQDDILSYIKSLNIRIYTPGIINGSGASIISSETNTIAITGFYASDSNGEVLNVTSITSQAPDTSSIPYKLATVSDGTSYWSVGQTYIICAVYSETETTPIAHPVTGITYDTRYEGSYELYAYRSGTDTPASNSIYIGTVYVSAIDTVNKVVTFVVNNSNSVRDIFGLSAVSIQGTVPSSVSGTLSYSAGNSITVQDHINAIGSGTVTSKNPHGYIPSDIGFTGITVAEHELERHLLGIKTTYTEDTSALYGYVSWVTKSSGIYDSFVLNGFASSEYLYIPGYDAIGSSKYSGTISFSFVDGTTPFGACNIYIYYDPVAESIKVCTDHATTDYYYTMSSSSGSTRSLATHGISDPTTIQASNVVLWKLSWNPTPSTSYITECSVPPADGTSNFIAKYDLRKFIINDMSVPIGSIILYAGSSVPSNYYACDGSTKNAQDDYYLFSVIGNTYGGTAPSFTLPTIASPVVGATYIIHRGYRVTPA